MEIAHNRPIFIIKTTTNRYIYLLISANLSSILYHKKQYWILTTFTNPYDSTQ